MAVENILLDKFWFSMTEEIRVLFVRMLIIRRGALDPRRVLLIQSLIIQRVMIICTHLVVRRS